ncbi:hypothetical protein ZWY2020_056724 [Hordeum vulgare]|nr:hypothetical protein ZWY2020_056724 [Hordeum vulgare]
MDSTGRAGRRLPSGSFFAAPGAQRAAASAVAATRPRCSPPGHHRGCHFGIWWFAVTHQSPASAAWAILANPRPKARGPAPQYHQSAAVKVAVRPPVKPAMDMWDELDDDDELRHGMPPCCPRTRWSRARLLVAPGRPRFSMLEGASRTLKAETFDGTRRCAPSNRMARLNPTR